MPQVSSGAGSLGLLPRSPSQPCEAGCCCKPCPPVPGPRRELSGNNQQERANSRRQRTKGKRGGMAREPDPQHFRGIFSLLPLSGYPCAFVPLVFWLFLSWILASKKAGARHVKNERHQESPPVPSQLPPVRGRLAMGPAGRAKGVVSETAKSLDRSACCTDRPGRSPSGEPPAQGFPRRPAGQRPDRAAPSRFARLQCARRPDSRPGGRGPGFPDLP